MGDRHEFTARDGSKRWCSRELYSSEEGFFSCQASVRAPGCKECNMLRRKAFKILKPKPTALRWKATSGHKWTLLWGGVSVGWIYNEGVDWYWRDFTCVCHGRGTLSDCARALVKAAQQ